MLRRRDLLLVAAMSATPSIAQSPVPGTVPITTPINQSALPFPTGGGNFFDNTKGNLVRFQLSHVAPIGIDAAIGAYLFATNNAGQRLAVVYLPSHTLVAEIPTGPGITAIASRPGTAEAWAVDSINGCVSVIDPIQNRHVRTISVGKEPHGIVFTPNGSRAYVTCSADNKVDVIDCSSYLTVHSIPIPNAVAPRGIEIVTDASNNSTVWVTPFFSGNNTVAKRTQPGSSGFASSQAVVNPDPATDNPLPDQDLFAITVTAAATTDFLDTSRTRTGLGTILFNVHADPSGAELWIPNTEALNTIVGEANLVGGKVVSNRITIAGTAGGALQVLDLDTMVPSGAAQPTSVTFDAVRGLAYVSCFGSDKIVAINTTTKAFAFAVSLTPLTPPHVYGNPQTTTPARCGPRGMVLSANGNELYVFNGIDNSYSTVDLVTQTATTARTLGYDPTPDAVKRGMGHLANADHSLSKTTSCMSCHVDGHFDMLSWNLSGFVDPPGTTAPVFEKDNKGPMATQSLRGLFEADRLHWRGEQKGLDDFNQGGFVGLMKRPGTLPQEEFDELKAATFSLVYPANPRQPAGRMYTGDALLGLDAFRTAPAVGASACASCHRLPLGSNLDLQAFSATAFPANSGKVTQLRGVGDKVAADEFVVFPLDPLLPKRTVNGWGLSHSATVHSVFRFVSNFPGLTDGDVTNITEFVTQFDTGLAPMTAFQKTVANAAEFNAALAAVRPPSFPGEWDIVVAGSSSNVPFTLAWDHVLQTWQTGTAGSVLSDAALLQLITSTNGPITFFGQPLGTGRRFGVDRDLDGFLNDDEVTRNPPTNPTNPDSDGDGFLDGHEILYPGVMDPLVPNATSPDTQPPSFTNPITVIWFTSTTAKLEFSTDEPTRAEVVIGMASFEATTSPTAGSFDVNHSIFLRALDPNSITTVKILITDNAGQTKTQLVGVSTVDVSPGTRISGITNSGLVGSTITVNVTAEAFLTPTMSLQGHDLVLFAHAEAPGVPLTGIPMPTTLTIGASNTVPVQVTIPATVLAGLPMTRKLHFGVRDLRPPQIPGLAYIEARDATNFVTITF